MEKLKLCRDCEEEINAARLRLFPLADKCSDCSAPLSSQITKSPSKHSPQEECSDFEVIERQPANLEQKVSDTRPKKPALDFRSYECPFCESKVNLRQLSYDQYKLTCKECGWSDSGLQHIRSTPWSSIPLYIP